MTVSATWAIIAVVQTPPNRSVEPPEPRFLSCPCTCDPVALSAGSTPRIAAPATVSPRRVEHRGELQARVDPERQPAALAGKERGQAELQRPVRGHEADDGRDRRQYERLDEELATIRPRLAPSA